MTHYTGFKGHEGIKMPTPHMPPSAVRRALRKLGADMRDARRRRNLTAAVVAERAFTSRKTLQRIEAGDHGVGIGIYASVLHTLGFLDRLSDIADPGADAIGLALSGDSLPQRVRAKSKKH